MATLQITRSSEYANRLRKIKLFLDSVELDTISNGESKDFKIAGGKHKLQAKIDWCKSNKFSFEIEENDITSVTLTSFAKHNPLGSLATIYYVTFGASKYLHIQEK